MNMVPLHELIQKRESQCIIDPRRPVEEKKIRSLFEVARGAPIYRLTTRITSNRSSTLLHPVVILIILLTLRFCMIWC